MKAFKNLVDAIEIKMLEVGTDNIDYSSEKDDRFKYGCASSIESKNNSIYFNFDVYDCGTGFHFNSIEFDDNCKLKNIIEKLNKTTFKHEI